MPSPVSSVAAGLMAAFVSLQSVAGSEERPSPASVQSLSALATVVPVVLR